MGTVNWNGQPLNATDCRMHVYHLDAPEADFNIDARVDQVGELRLSGTFLTKSAGPCEAEIHFVDQPTEVMLDGSAGLLTTSGKPSALLIEILGDRAVLRGRQPLYWNALDDCDGPGTRDFSFELDLDDIPVTKA